MADSSSDSKVRDTLHRLTTALRDTRERLRVAESGTREPIAVVGMGCRFPGGADDPDGLWRLLAEGRDAITPFPADRGWPRDATGAGGFLSDPAWFDPGFFGISPNEALTMDPQHRLLLEISWEALERGGIDPAALRGSRTGVFAGTSDRDYLRLLLSDLNTHADHLATATAASVLSGRIAYALGLEGPSLSIDTACSSSLVALHLAVRSLRSGECDLALVGGALVMSTPDVFSAFQHQGALAADGRCKAFAESADGVGWGEGAGVVVVERLADAVENGHPVLAVIRGTAVNSDGASNGLTAPNGRAQQRVIRDALADARLQPADIDVVEAHGTGTRLGDPIEAAALQAAYGRDRAVPLAVGSVKSNLGHTQAAAGIAGVLKMVLSLRHRHLPPTLHAERPTSQVDWTDGGVELLTEGRPWLPADDRPRRAGVSSFGISGANAHVILEEAPPAEPRGTVAQLPWVLSARTESALQAKAGQLLSHVDGRDPAALAHALLTSRSTFDRRAVVLDADPKAALTALRRGAAVPGLVTGAGELTGKVVFVFPGQGGQWAGMAADLLKTSPVFRAQLERCADALAPHVDWDLLAVLHQHPDAPTFDRVDVVQPALFAVMVSLAALWRECGIEPDAVVGQSQGEIAAACVAGALSLEDAARTVALRAKALTELSGHGGMASVELPVEQVRPLLDERLAVATVNGPESTVVAGDLDALEKLLAELGEAGTRVRRLAVDYASHSPQVELIRDRVLADLAPISPVSAKIPFCSAVTGTVLAGTDLDAAYWYRNLRLPSRFDQAVAGLAVPEHSYFVEVSPHPVLVPAILAAVGDRAAVTGTLRRDRSSRDTFLAAMAELYVRGLSPQWTVWAEGTPEFAELPTYPFERTRFWVTPGERHGSGHPVLGEPVELGGSGELVLTGRLSASSAPWLADHRVLDEVIVPGTAWLEFALRAGAAANCPAVEELILERPLAVPDDTTATVQLRVGAPAANGRRTLTLHAKVDGAEWVRHGEGVVRPEQAPPEPLGEWPPADAEPLSPQELYPTLVDRGLHYGPAFQCLRALWHRDGEVFAEVAGSASTRGFLVHPAMLDSALHPIGYAGAAVSTDGPTLPFSWTGVTAYGNNAAVLRVRLRGLADGSVQITATDETGAPVLSVESLVLRPAVRGTATPDSLLRNRWVEVRSPSSIGTDALAAVGIETDQFPAFPDLDALAANDGPMPEAVLVSGTGESVREATHHALQLIQQWLVRPEFSASRLVFRTSGANATRPGEDVPDLPGAAVTGLVRSAQTEQPGRFVLLDADEITPRTLTAALATGEPELALREGRVFARRLVRAFPSAQEKFAGPEDTALITGGTGTLGGLLARHLVTAHGVRRLVLTSRRGQAPELTDELTALGATVTTVACDAADRAQMTHLLDTHEPTVIVHAAGTLDDGVVTAMTPDRLDTVLRPKADAALLLHELTKDRPLKQFVLFSSAAASTGNGGQSNYAAANAVLDGLACHRRAHGRPAIALAWGLWAERSDLTRHLGTTADELSTKEALALFDAAVGCTDPVLVPARFTPDGRPLLRELGGPAAPDEQPAAVPHQETELVTLVLTEVAQALGHESADVLSPSMGFLEMGVDSLAAVRIRNRLAEALDLTLRSTVTFDHPNPVALARHLADRLSGAEPESATPVLDPLEQRILAVQVSDWKKTRTFFHTAAEIVKPARIVRLASGNSGRPPLVCLTSAVGNSDPVQYVHLAKPFHGERDVLGLCTPGFRPEDALAGSRDMLLESFTVALRDEIGDRPVVLTGLSSGGLLAHVLAEYWCGQGLPLAGVALLDTYPLQQSEQLVTLLPGLAREMQLRLEGTEYSMPQDDGWISAMVHYGSFDWSIRPVPVPELFVLAGEPVEGWPEDWAPKWPFPHTRVVTRGNHFSMLEEHGPHTAALVDAWMRAEADG